MQDIFHDWVRCTTTMFIPGEESWCKVPWVTHVSGVVRKRLFTIGFVAKPPCSSLKKRASAKCHRLRTTTVNYTKHFPATYVMLSVPQQHVAQRIRLHYLRISYVAVIPHHLCKWSQKIFKDPFTLLTRHSIVGYCDNPIRDNSVLSPKPLLLVIKR
jgi:hypothetical protein